jgi:hypothetical protein
MAPASGTSTAIAENLKHECITFPGEHIKLLDYPAFFVYLEVLYFSNIFPKGATEGGQP